MSQHPELTPPANTSDVIHKASLKKEGLRGKSGIVFGAIALLALVVLLIVLSRAIETSRRVKTVNHMRQIAVSNLNYQISSIGHSFAPSEAGSNLSWRVHILSFLGYQDLRDQFRFDEPWDSPHNIKLLPQIPIEYTHPQLQSTLPKGYTVFQMPTSKLAGDLDAICVKGEAGARVGQVLDGYAKTAMLLELNSASAVPWTKPEDWEFDPENPARNLRGAFSGGCIVTFCDCGTYFLDTANTSKADLNAIFTKRAKDVAKMPAKILTKPISLDPKHPDSAFLNCRPRDRLIDENW